MLLKHSAPDSCFFEDRGFDPHWYYARVREIGCTAVELVEPSEWAAARDEGLEIIAIAGGGMRDGLNDLENHATLTRKIVENIHAAAENHISNVIVFSGNRKGIDERQGLANVVAGVKQIAPEAERSGVGLLFEMLNAFDHADYQADNSEFGFGVVEAAGLPVVRVLYDVYHMYRSGLGNDEIIAELTGKVDCIGHIHVAGAPKRDFPGTAQEIDYARIIPALHEAGYSGHIGHEFMPADDPLAELAEAVALFESYAGK